MPPAPVIGTRAGEQPAPPSYRVARGDTLYAIAFRFGLDYRDVATWNRLSSPDRIFAGQVLRLRSPGTAAAAPVVAAAPPRRESVPAGTSSERTAENRPTVVARTAEEPAAVPTGSSTQTRAGGRLSWNWPTQGRVVRTFDPDVPGRKGIQIAGSLGQPIKAASPGVVVYSGSGLPGYGRLIILKHPNNLLSAYGYLGKIVVKEGDSVKLGQTIAELGSSADNRPVLHFEIRENGKPVNPLRYLPS